LRKSLNIIFLTIFALLTLVNSAGYFIYYKAETYKIKKEFKTRLRKINNSTDLPNEIVEIRIHKKEIRKLIFKEKYEFEYQNNLYDIIKKEIHGDSIYYFTLIDEVETKLVANYKDKLKSDKKTDNKLVKLSTEYLPINSEIVYLIFRNSPRCSIYIEPKSNCNLSRLLKPPCLIS